MYLAKKRIKKKIHYVIRESLAHGDSFKSRDLVDLGPNPEACIVYPDSGHAFYFDEALCDALKAKGVKPDNEELEQVFWPFIDPASRRAIEGFSRTPPGRETLRREQKKRCQTETFHMFDQRRMHYLRFGEMDQSRLNRAPRTLYRKLLDKSRDEIEQQFMAMEQVLQAHEKKTYAFVIFDVAGSFSSEIARQFPQALPQEKVDDCFLDAVCRLNTDPSFWADLEMCDTLHEYLIRYVCWFFDNDFDGGRYLDDLIWQFKRRHHGFRPPPPREAMPVEEALKLMGIEKSAFATMTVKTLTRQYRGMAKKYHPDQGGEHEQFIRLNRAFEDLMRKLKGKKRATHYHTRRG
ncbi:MAG: J domain-containing protein [Thermodesulfobacteriota bacterium]|nr:J domain-containing protein [Thermodesulfobacteriota bacterium]